MASLRPHYWASGHSNHFFPFCSASIYRLLHCNHIAHICQVPKPDILWQCSAYGKHWQAVLVWAGSLKNAVSSSQLQILQDGFHLFSDSLCCARSLVSTEQLFFFFSHALCSRRVFASRWLQVPSNALSGCYLTCTKSPHHAVYAINPEMVFIPFLFILSMFLVDLDRYTASTFSVSSWSFTCCDDGVLQIRR